MKWTGAAVWDAAIVLAEFLAANPHFIQGKRVLEVGAGLALPSVTAGAFGAQKVVASDYDEIVLGLARKNLAANVSTQRLKNALIMATACAHSPIHIIHMDIHMHMHMHIHIHIHIHTSTCTCAYTYTDPHAHSHSHSRTNAHTHAIKAR
jgi:predicted nicotinamide N-methyase